MKPAIAALLALCGGCAPYPGYGYPAPRPMASEQECTAIRQEIAQQQRIAEESGVMTSPLVQWSILLNTTNVITGLQQQAAITGCPA